MTHRAPASRTMKVEALARVEGEGAMYVEIDGEQVTDVQLQIYEPPRFFEAFLRGRRLTEPPDITARICGICPVAYQMSACNAVEDALGVEVTGPSGTCAASCTAVSGSRATRSTSTCSTRPTSSASTAPSS